MDTNNITNNSNPHETTHAPRANDIILANLLSSSDRNNAARNTFNNNVFDPSSGVSIDDAFNNLAAIDFSQYGVPSDQAVNSRDSTVNAKLDGNTSRMNEFQYASYKGVVLNYATQLANVAWALRNRGYGFTPYEANYHINYANAINNLTKQLEYIANREDGVVSTPSWHQTHKNNAVQFYQNIAFGNPLSNDRNGNGWLDGNDLYLATIYGA